MTIGFAVNKILFLLFSVVTAKNSTVKNSATIYGPAICEAVFEDLRTTFILAHQAKNYSMEYEVTSDDEVGSHLALGQAIIVDTLKNIPNNSISLPLLGFPLVIVFNLNNVSTLNLSQQALVDIFLGRITQWNDPNLTATNPNAVLPVESIQLVAGPLLDRFTEAISALAGQPVSLNNLTTNTTFGDVDVGARVKATPNTLGFSWMADALASKANLVWLQNKDGFFVTPNDGAASALTEFRAVSSKLKLPDTLPHNMAGRFSWPLMGILYVVVPHKVASCDELLILQRFLSFVLFRTPNVDLMVELLGWQAAETIFALDGTLGTVPDEIDAHEKLYSLECGTKDDYFDVLVGTTSDLQLNLLKLIVPYSGEVDSAFQLATFTNNITTLLDAMVLQTNAAVEVDAVLAWEPVLAPYPQLPTVDVYMGSVVTAVNIGLGTAAPILSLPVIADIFMRVITHWNDSRIVALNPGTNLPNASINVLAGPLVPHGQTELFAQLLGQYSLNFSWDRVEKTIASEHDVRDRMGFVQNAIGYGFGHLVQEIETPYIPRIIGFGNVPVAFSANSLSACWVSRQHPDCWPLAVPLSIALRRPDAGSIPCIRQQRSVKFVWWVSKASLKLNPFLVPNLNDNNLGEAEFCDGRSLVMTRPEPQTLNNGARALVQAFSAIAVIWALAQAVALGVARKRSELKSASVVFSIIANVGVYFILWTPFMLISESPKPFNCNSTIWFLSIGFTLCYGSLFVKLFRLYVIFTSRKLVVPRLSNKKLLMIMGAFLFVDLVLLIGYTADTPPYPAAVSSFVPDDRDLVTGKRELTLFTCTFNIYSWLLQILLVVKFLIAFGGAAMAFFIRNVDRRFSAVSALGWAFYNMFLTSIVAALVLVFFESAPENRLATSVFTPIFCGLWIMYITLLALTLDSNVLLACKDFSKPLRKMLATKDFRVSRSTKNPDTAKVSDDSTSTEPKQSRSSTFFVVNREMFPSKYNDFETTLLEQVLEELNFQRAAVRRVLALNSTGTGTMCIELAEVGERNRGSTAASPRSKPGLSSAPNEKFSHENSRSAASSQSHSATASQISDIYDPKPMLSVRNSSDPLLPYGPLPRLQPTSQISPDIVALPSKSGVSSDLPLSEVPDALEPKQSSSTVGGNLDPSSNLPSTSLPLSQSATAQPGISSENS